MPDQVQEKQGYPSQFADGDSLEIETMLYARKAEIDSLNDLTTTRGTPIPALFSQFYKFISNPSSVSVETFKRMVDTDDTIGSGVDFLTTCLSARMGMYTHPSEEITQWVNEHLEKIEGGWVANLKRILSATWAGFSVHEKVWANEANGFVPKRLVPLPPSTVLFETDRVGNLTEDGILQYQRNFNPQVLSQGLGFFGGTVSAGFGFASDVVRPDIFAKFGDLPFPMRTANTFNYLSIRIPRQKCIHYSFDAQGNFGNHYGRSLLRRAYKFYVIKDAVLQMMVIALDRKGTPLTIIFADPHTTVKDGDKVQAGTNAKGQKVGKRADEAARDAFKNIHNDSTIILPGKKDQIYSTEFVPQAANTQDFISALDFCNKSIMRALLIPSLIFTSGDGSGSFALGQEHAKTFDKLLDSMNGGLQAACIQQLVREMIAYNFPRSAWEKDGLGEFSKRQLTQDERSKEMEVFEKAINSGIVDSQDLNDLNQMRDSIGFDPRETPIAKQGGLGGPLGEIFGARNPFEQDQSGNPPGTEPGENKEQQDGQSNGAPFGGGDGGEDGGGKPFAPGSKPGDQGGGKGRPPFGAGGQGPGKARG
jgi:hypothetical protein